MLQELNLNDPLQLALAVGTGMILLLLVLLGVLACKYYLLKNRLTVYGKLLAERQRLQQQAQLEAERLRSQQLQAIREQAVLTENRAELQRRLQEQLADKHDKLQTIAKLNEEIVVLRERNADLRSQGEALAELRKADQQRFQLSSRELEKRLSSLGERLLQERSQALAQQSAAQFKQAVSPLEAELEVFRNFLQQSQRSSAEQTGALSHELRRLQEAQLRLTDQASDLAMALSSGGKSQGIWGELQLERVLEAAGLTSGVEYQREVSGKRLYGEHGRPDAIIRLPDEHCLIIDAKCSLTDYTRYINAQGKEEQESALRAHLGSLKKHIHTLAQRDYAGYTSLNSPSFVFMFVPVDGALTQALHAQSSLYDEAARQNVYLVSPSTLMPALRVVANLWMLSSQNERMRKLALEAQQVYSQFCLVLTAYEELCQKQDSAAQSLSLLGDRLVHGRGNLQQRLEHFQQKAPQQVATSSSPASQEQILIEQPDSTSSLAQFELLDAKGSH